MLDRAISGKLGIAEMKKLPGEGFKRPAAAIKMDEVVCRRIEALFKIH